MSAFLHEAKSIAISPKRNSDCLFRRPQGYGKGSEERWEKNSIVVLREKDLRISQLQQEVSKKQVLIEAYEDTMGSLGRTLASHKHQL